MAFAPVPVPPTVLSTRSRELSGKLEEAIEAYQRQHPEVSRAEVARALGAVQASRRTATPKARATAVALGATVAAGVGLFIALGSNGGALPDGSPIGMAGIALIVGVAILVLRLKLRRSSEE